MLSAVAPTLMNDPTPDPSPEPSSEYEADKARAVELFNLSRACLGLPPLPPEEVIRIATQGSYRAKEPDGGSPAKAAEWTDGVIAALIAAMMEDGEPKSTKRIAELAGAHPDDILPVLERFAAMGILEASRPWGHPTSTFWAIVEPRPVSPQALQQILALSPALRAGPAAAESPLTRRMLKTMESYAHGKAELEAVADELPRVAAAAEAALRKSDEKGPDGP